MALAAGAWLDRLARYSNVGFMLPCVQRAYHLLNTIIKGVTHTQAHAQIP